MSKVNLEVGDLYVRIQVGSSQMTLGYGYMKKIQHGIGDYRQICEMQDFRVKPYFSSGGVAMDVAIIAGNNDVTAHLHLCSWTELLAIKRLWYTQGNIHNDSYSRFDSWVDEVVEVESLLSKDWKERLTKLKDPAQVRLF